MIVKAAVTAARYRRCDGCSRARLLQAPNPALLLGLNTSSLSFDTMDTKASYHIFRIILYTLAGFIFAVGLIGGISLIAGSSNLHNLLLPFQLMGFEAAANLLAPALRSLISGAGVFTLVSSAGLSLMLFSLGRLLGRIANLEARLARLEA